MPLNPGVSNTGTRRIRGRKAVTRRVGDEVEVAKPKMDFSRVFALHVVGRMQVPRDKLFLGSRVSRRQVKRKARNRVIAPLDAGRGETTVVTKEEVGDAEVGVSIAT